MHNVHGFWRNQVVDPVERVCVPDDAAEAGPCVQQVDEQDVLAVLGPRVFVVSSVYGDHAGNIVVYAGVLFP